MNILAFSPHPDDAEIAMGGTLAKYSQEGHNVLIVVVTIPNQKGVRMAESVKAARILGAQLLLLDIDSYELSFNRKTIQVFDKVINDFYPDIIYTSWIHDPHQDHVNVAKATIASARKNSSSLYMYNKGISSGSTPYAFRSQILVDTSSTMAIKLKSVMVHQSQVENHGQQWIKGIVARDGYMGYLIHTKYAESFEVIKEVR